MKIRQARRLSTILKDAGENGLGGVITHDSIVTNPKTGNIVKNYGKSVLHVYNEVGQPLFTHYTGISHANNLRAEHKLNEVLGRTQEQSSQESLITSSE